MPSAPISFETDAAFPTQSADRDREKKTHTPPAMPPARSDLAMDDAESVLWFLARSSVALDPDVLVAASAVDDDGAAMVAKKETRTERRERKGKGRRVPKE